MGNATFGHQNLLLAGGVTLTPSSEAAGFDADNLKKPHPSDFWRATTITSPVTLGAAFSSPQSIDLVAVLYTNATPHTNLVRYSNDLTQATWQKTNIGTVLSLSGIAGAFDRGQHVATIFAVPEDTANGEHSIKMPFSRLKNVAGIGPNQRGHYSVIARSSSTGATTYRHLRLRLTDSVVGDAYQDFDLETGTLIGSAFTDTGWTLDGAGITDLGSGYYLCEFDAIPHQSAGALEFVIQMLFHDETPSYTGTTGGLFVAAPFADDPQTTLRDWAPSSAGSGSQWGLYATILTEFVSPRALPLYSTQIGWSEKNGWIHAYAKLGAPVIHDTVTLNLHDPDNADGYFDLGNLYLGPSFQVDFNYQEDLEIVPSAIDPLISRGGGGTQFRGAVGKVRRWRLNFERQTLAQTMLFHAMHQAVGASTPVVCILNPDETTYGQEQIVYAWIEDLRIRERGYRLSVGQSLYQVQMTLLEVIP